MKRRLGTLLLALSLVLALLPTGAFAVETVIHAEVENDFYAAATLEPAVRIVMEADIALPGGLTFAGDVTLDLNGHVLRLAPGSSGSVLTVGRGKQMTIIDSRPETVHKFTPNDDGLWVLDEESGSETVRGGIITGGTGREVLIWRDIYNDCGGGVYLEPGAVLNMESGSIVGCTATDGGGVFIESDLDGAKGAFYMNGGSILGCAAADGGGGVYANAQGSILEMCGSAVIRGCRSGSSAGGVRIWGTMKMSDRAAIRGCVVEGTGMSPYGGGVYINSGSHLTMTGQSVVENCQVIFSGSAGGGSSCEALGGGVYVSNGAYLTMEGGAAIQSCAAENTAEPGKACGGGVYADIFKEITLEGTARIEQCRAANGSGMHLTGTEERLFPGWGMLRANGGTVSGDVVLGDRVGYPCTVRGTGKTAFTGTVTVEPGSTIETGDFRGEVINNGTISGGTFSGKVTNNGVISNGIFTGTVTNNEGGSVTGGDFRGEMVNNGGTVDGSLYWTVRFNTDGGSGVDAQTVFRGKAAARPADPRKEGHTFLGWYRSAEDAEPYDFTAPVTGDLTLMARWQPKTYLVVYYPDQYTENPVRQEETKVHDVPLTLPGAIFTRAGYTQSGWTTGQTDYPLGGTYTGNTEIILKPLWRANRYTITFDTDGGSALEPLTLDYGAAVTPPAAPTRPGFTFVGWDRAFPETMPAENLTFRALWRADSIAPTAPRYAIVLPGETEHGTVTVHPKSAAQGETVSITVTPHSGYVPETLSAADSTGKALALTPRGEGEYTFTMPASRVEVQVTFMEDNGLLNFFYDVPNDAYCYGAVRWAAEKGITGGVGNGLFGPEQPCTRGQIVTLLWRAAGSPEPAGMRDFADIPASSYYAKAVAWAVEQGITTGTGGGKFSPDAPCTRGQAVTFLARSQKAGETGTADFSDVPADSPYAPAVAWAVAQGITTGTGEGKFSPDAPCTRGQIVTFLYRASINK